MFDKLTEDNFIQFAIKNYNNPQCHTLKEFEDDLKRFLYLKKLFSRYSTLGELRERLIVNHTVILYNIFGKAATRMLFYKIDQEYWPYLAAVLVYLDRMPEYIQDFSLNPSELEIDEKLANALRNL